MNPYFQVDTLSPLDVAEFTPQASTLTWRDYGNTNSAYVGGRITDANRDWVPLHYSGDSAIRESWDLLTARIRDLCRNDAVLSKLLHQIVTLVIGSGILTFSDAMSRAGMTDTFHDEFADQSDDLFDHWAENEADASGRMSFYDMQHLSFSEVVQVGACLWREVMLNDPNRRVPLAYQLLEWEQLDRSMDRDAAPGRTRISNGIEFSGVRPIAYWLFDAHPYDTQIGGATSSDFQFKSRRVPARQIIHNFLPDRISSNTGISWFSSLIQVSRDRDHYWTNELRSSALRALMAIHVKRASGQGAFGATLSGATDPTTGTRSVKMGYPSVIETGINEDVSLLQSGSPPNDTTEWIKTMHLHTAMGGKLSLNRLLGDASEAVFASIKASFLDDERTVSPIQQHQALHVILPIRRRVNEIAAAVGRFTSVTPQAFMARSEVYQRFDWVAAGDPDLQPKDDGEAATDRMRTGRTTPQYEIARLGFHWRKNLRDWKRYFAELDRLGLEAPDFSKGQGGLYIPFRGPVEQVAPGVGAAPSTPSSNGNGRRPANAR